MDIVVGYLLVAKIWCTQQSIVLLYGVIVCSSSVGKYVYIMYCRSTGYCVCTYIYIQYTQDSNTQKKKLTEYKES